jgi:hypothetical protein
MVFRIDSEDFLIGFHGRIDIAGLFQSQRPVVGFRKCVFIDLLGHSNSPPFYLLRSVYGDWSLFAMAAFTQHPGSPEGALVHGAGGRPSSAAALTSDGSAAER